MRGFVAGPDNRRAAGQNRMFGIRAYGVALGAVTSPSLSEIDLQICPGR